MAVGSHGSGLLYGAAFIILLKSFANGGSSLTGLEAISNGVGAFREPTSRNARQTLVVMSSVLGFLVLGVTLIAHWTHAVPYVSGSPTVVSQEVKYVLGTGPAGKFLFYVVQFATMLILYTGGNTSFNGFPFLANFVAEDSYLPKQLTRRGHRLAFSNGIIVLTIVALALIIATGAQLSALVALYAIGVFTGFAMAGSGMIKHHLTARGPKWRRGVVVNTISAFLTALIVLIFATVKFNEGAWVVVIVGPIMYFGLIRLHRQYVVEDEQLEEGATEAAEAPVLSRHEVVVLVDRLDMATARALQYARTLHPDVLRAIHFALDPLASEQLEEEWRRLGLSDFPLDIQECEDRRLTRAALELAAETVADRKTELTILLPRRIFASGWQRVLHDNTAETIATAVGHLEHVNATVVPYQLSGGWWSNRREWRRKAEEASAHGPRPTGGRQGRRPGAGGTGPVPPARPSASGPGAPSPSATSSGASGSGWPAGCARSGSSPGPAPPTSSASWPTTAGCSCSCSRAGAGSRASSPEPGWWWRAWSATGPGARPSSTRTTSSSPGRRRRRSPSDGRPGARFLPLDPVVTMFSPIAGTRRARGGPPAPGRPAVTSHGGDPVPRRPRRDAPFDRVAIDRNHAVHRREPHR